MKLLFKLFLIGIIAGSFLGGLLQLIQNFTGKEVYTLLLNVDYLPFVKKWEMAETTEFFLHLIVSVGVVYVFYYGLKIKRTFHYMWISALIGGLLFLTTSFSERTPDLTDYEAFLYWVSAHIVYGFIIGYLVKGRAE